MWNFFKKRIELLSALNQYQMAIGVYKELIAEYEEQLRQLKRENEGRKAHMITLDQELRDLKYDLQEAYDRGVQDTLNTIKERRK